MILLNLSLLERMFEGMDWSRASSDELEQGFAHFGGLRAAADAELCSLIQSVDRPQMWMTDGARSLSEWVSLRLRIRYSTAKRPEHVRFRETPVSRSTPPDPTTSHRRRTVRRPKAAPRDGGPPIPPTTMFPSETTVSRTASQQSRRAVSLATRAPETSSETDGSSVVSASRSTCNVIWGGEV